MSTGRRRLCYVEFALIGISALSEWLSVMLGLLEGLPGWPILLAKWADYILTPLAGGAVAWQLRIHNRWEKALNALLAFNVVFQTVAFLTGQMLVLDENNQYEHGNLYMAYVVIYVAILAIIVIQFVHYGQSFSKQNRGSLYMTLGLAIVGVSLQELVGGEVRVAYLTLALVAAFLYIRNGEFFQLAQDQSMAAQRTLLMVDDLTGVGSRRAYSESLKELAAHELPSDLAIFCVDVNGLKEANDVLGHAAGDKLIRGAADCIQDVFAPAGSCFRTGGDEFVVLTSMDREQAERAIAALERQASAWEGEANQELHLACGYALAIDWPDATPEGLVTHADQAMYEAKEAFYQQEGSTSRKDGIGAREGSPT